MIRDGAIDETATRERRAALAQARDEGTWSVPTACLANWTGQPRIPVEGSTVKGSTVEGNTVEASV